MDKPAFLLVHRVGVRACVCLWSSPTLFKSKSLADGILASKYPRAAPPPPPPPGGERRQVGVWVGGVGGLHGVKKKHNFFRSNKSQYMLYLKRMTEQEGGKDDAVIPGCFWSTGLHPLL